MRKFRFALLLLPLLTLTACATMAEGTGDWARDMRVKGAGGPSPAEVEGLSISYPCRNSRNGGDCDIDDFFENQRA